MSSFHVAVALDGAGWHPAAWRLESARPAELFDPQYWADLAVVADRAGIDLLTFEDSLTLQSADPRHADDRVDQVRGRVDAHLVATYVAPRTRRIGLMPTITTTHPEPFHVANRVASLDHVSHGRAGWRVQVLRQPAEATQFGRRGIDGLPDRATAAQVEQYARPLFDEAADSVEVARRLWDSWEDDAEIRDRPTGRFIDRDKLHYVDFEGPFFSVRGPSITPRPPQGQPVVGVLAHVGFAYDLAVKSADIVFVTPHDDGPASILEEVRAAERVLDRAEPLLVFAELLVLLEPDEAAARAALAELDDLAGAPLRSDALVVASGIDALADRLAAWARAGIDGFRLRPARLPLDLTRIADDLVPALRHRGVLHDRGADTLRGRLGLARPLSRYAGRTGGRL